MRYDEIHSQFASPSLLPLKHISFSKSLPAEHTCTDPPILLWFSPPSLPPELVALTWSPCRRLAVGRVLGRRDWAHGTSLPEKQGVGRLNLHHTKPKSYKCSAEGNLPIRTPKKGCLDIRSGPDVAPRGTHHASSAASDTVGWTDQGTLGCETPVRSKPPRPEFRETV